MLPTSAIRLYVRYKANSKELFAPIVGRDLTTLQDWPPSEVTAYTDSLAEGYVQNSISFGARKKFRDQYVAAENRDEGHEAAIRAAERNCATYVKLYSEFTAALRRLRSQAISTDDIEEDFDDEGPGRLFSGRTEDGPSVPVPSDEDILTSAWEAAMKERAERETEVERFVAELYARSDNIIRNLKVAEKDVIPILVNLLRSLAPSVSVKWEWGDAEATAALIRHRDIPDEDLRVRIVQAAVKHKKFEKSLECAMPPRWRPPLTSDPVRKKKYNLVTLLFLIDECRSQLMSGSYAWSVQHLIALRECVKHFRAHGEFDGVPLRKPPSQQELDSGGKALVAEVLIDPLSTPLSTPLSAAPSNKSQPRGRKGKRVLHVVDPPLITQEAAWSEAHRVWKGITRKHFRGSDPPAFLRLVLTTFARVLDGSADFTLAVIHPAQFLRDAAAIPDVDSLVAATRLLRSDGDDLSPMLGEIYKILTASEGVFDLQYFDNYVEFTRTGRMPQHLGDRNPFEEDEKNVVYGVTKLMKEMNMLML